MKRISTILLTFQLLTFHGQLEALFDIKKFRQGEHHFVETYLYIFGPSLLEDRDTNVKNKKVEILLFIENEQKEIVDYKKHVIEGEIDHINKNGIKQNSMSEASMIILKSHLPCLKDLMTH